jgi:hypothetical protein
MGSAERLFCSLVNHESPTHAIPPNLNDRVAKSCAQPSKVAGRQVSEPRAAPSTGAAMLVRAVLTAKIEVLVEQREKFLFSETSKWNVE